MRTDIVATIVVTPRERFSAAERALQSIISNTSAPHHLVYVAGGAPAYVREYLTEACQRRNYELILRSEYLAPNVARNIGLQRVKTEYVVFIENDVVVEPGWLEALVGCANETGADVVSPLCLIGEPSEGMIHIANGTLQLREQDGKRWLSELKRHSGVCLRTRPLQLQRQPCDFSESHCMLVRREVFDRVGPLDENMLGTADEFDLALHLRDAGGISFFEPGSVVSYLETAEYTVSDLEFFALRWRDEWFEKSVSHLCRKWNLTPEAEFFADYHSFLRRHQEICRLPRAHRSLLRSLPAAQHGFAQTIIQLLNQLDAAEYPPSQIEQVRSAYATATELFAGCFRESGKTFLSHLVGTASILVAFGAEISFVVAGLLHAAYRVGRFPRNAGRDFAAWRRWMARRTGAQAEAVVLEYSYLEFATARAAAMESEIDRMRLNLARAVLVRIANNIEDHLDLGLAYCRNSGAALDQWWPVYEQVTTRLHYADMLAVLQSMREEVRNTRIPDGIRADAAGSYVVLPETGAIEPMIVRQLPPVDRTPVSGGQRLPGISDAGALPLHGRIAKIGIGTVIKRIPLTAFAAQNSGSIDHNSGGLTVRTDPRQWAYSALVELDPPKGAYGPAVLRIRLQVESGELGIGLLLRGSSTEFVTPEQSQDRCEQPTELLFPFPALEEVGALVLRSWAPSGVVTVARIISVDIHRPAGGS